jgi:hypothetical protein
VFYMWRWPLYSVRPKAGCVPLSGTSLFRMRTSLCFEAFPIVKIGLYPLQGHYPNLDNECIGRLIGAALIACAQRDVALATAIASTAITMAHRACSDSDAGRIFQVLLLASTAFQNEDMWAEWLERQLAEAAFRLPAGEPSKMFLKHLQELKKVLKLSLGIHVRAEALASAAN